MSKSKAKGTAWETAIVNYLTTTGIPAERVAFAGGSDRGDVRVGIKHRTVTFTIEAKNTQAITLASFIDEATAEALADGSWAGVAWVHRRGKASPGDGYVVMTGRTFSALLARLYVGSEVFPL